MSKKYPIYGHGINDADYPIGKNTNGKIVMCPIYQRWTAILARVYNTNNKKNSICKEWLLFSNFRKWIMKQDWKEKHLDKDILYPGNEIYSPETCLFVSRGIKNLFNTHKSKRGNTPQGVSYNEDDDMYRSQIQIHGKKKYLGYFKTSLEAEQAYLVVKYDYVKSHIHDNKHDKRLVEGLNRHLELIKNKIDDVK